MLLQLLLVCRRLVLEIYYIAPAQDTMQNVLLLLLHTENTAKGKFGGCGIKRLRNPENYHLGRAKNSQETHSLVLPLSFPYSSAG